MVSLVATDSSSEKEWRGFYYSVSSTELKDEWESAGSLEWVARQQTLPKAGFWEA